MKYLIAIPFLFFCSLVLSQEAINITYEVESKGERVTTSTSNGMLPPETRRSIAQANKNLFEWITNSRYALYRKKEEELQTGGTTIRTSSFRMSIGSRFASKDKPFSYDQFTTSLWDYKEKNRIGIAEIFKKDFRINSRISAPSKAVKITDEKKKILGYTARKAVVERDNEVVETYWFTDELKVFSPYRLKGINGVILQIDLPTKSIKAVEIDKDIAEKNIFEDFITKYEQTKVIDKDQYADLLKEEQDEKMASVRKMLKGSNLNLDSIISDARKRAKKKIKKKN